MSTLPRTLGLRDLIFLIIGTVIGSGIFLVPGAVLRQVDGRVDLALLAWAVAGALSLLGALTYGELSAADPKAGGIYVYIRNAFGPCPAFLYGWTLFFAINSGSLATLAVAFSTYIGQLVSLGPVMTKVVASTMLVFVAIVNVRGTRKSADLQNWTTGIKVAAILILSGVFLTLGKNFPTLSSEAASDGAAGSLVSGFGLAMIAILWAYEGWQYCSFSAGEAIDAQRNFPRAFMIGSAALIGIYLLANVAYLAALGPVEAARSNSIAAAAVAAVINPSAAKIVALPILISIFSAANGLTLTAPRVFYAMANDKLFFRRLADVHPRFQTPAIAIVSSSLWAIVLAASGTFEQLFTYVIFSAWIFYALGAASLFVYRRRNLGAAGAYRVPGYPWTPLLFIIAAVTLVVNTLITMRGKAAAIGVGIILSGVPAYLMWRRRSHASA
jgi:APA family basic amino acid/polyamine antiporter